MGDDADTALSLLLSASGRASARGGVTQSCHGSTEGSVAAPAAWGDGVPGRPGLSIPMSPRRRVTRSLAGRRLAIVDGTSTWTDCALALRLLGAGGRILDGQALGEYERAFARLIGVRHAVSFASGRVGLYAVLRAMGVQAGDEVLLQVPTHVVVANAIRYAGARPIY